MSREKLRVANTQLDNLIENLRGEIGEVVTTWVVMRQFMLDRRRLSSGDLGKDLANRKMAFSSLLVDKLRDELIGRLSELAEKKVGQLTFYFAMRKLALFEREVEVFESFIIKNKIREKRNQDVSHKQLPEKWSDHTSLEIPYGILLKSVAMALRLMKRIDRHVLGPSAPYSWREARKKRYEYMSPPRAGYLLVPYIRLSEEDRIRILEEEIREGSDDWSLVPTMIDGHPASVMASPKWGIIALGDRLIALNEYPLQQLTSLETRPNIQPNAVSELEAEIA